MFDVSRRLFRVGPIIVFIGLIGVATTASWSAQDENARAVPPPALDERPGQSASEVAVFAGGCFWGVQAVFQHVKGVTAAVSGYAGGQERSARYEIVGRGNSGHAEAVRVTFDPHQVSYGRLLQVFFSVAHDPTQLNRQGPDVGSQYRSVLFPVNDEQATIARAYIAQLNDARVFDRPIATTIEMRRPFYDGEPYHQDFLERNRTHPYIISNDLPKLRGLERLFPDLYRSAPVLTAR
jgi:peptide-methionine (S)-S-oxide reductase